MISVHPNQISYIFWKDKIEDLSKKQLQTALILAMEGASIKQALRIVRKNY